VQTINVNNTRGVWFLKLGFAACSLPYCVAAWALGASYGSGSTFYSLFFHFCAAILFLLTLYSFFIGTGWPPKRGQSRRPFNRYLEPLWSKFGGLLIGYWVLLTLSFLFLLKWPALDSWDFLDFWGPYARSGLVGDAEVSGIGGRHPLATSWSFVGFYQMFGHGRAALLGYMLSGLSLIFCWLGIAISYSRSLLLALALVLVPVSIPLFSEHLLRPGYTAIWLGAALACALGSYFLFLLQRKGFWLAYSVCFLVLAALTRNTGFVYSLAVALTLLTHLGCRRLSRRWFRYIVLSGICCWLSFIAFLHLLSLGGASAEVISFSLGGRVLVFKISNAPLSIPILNHALLINQTFSVSFLVLCLSGYELFRNGLDDFQEVSFGAVAFLVTILWLSLLSDYGRIYARPVSDTGFSRFMLPITCLLWLNAVALSSNLKRFLTGG